MRCLPFFGLLVASTVLVQAQSVSLLNQGLNDAVRRAQLWGSVPATSSSFCVRLFPGGGGGLEGIDRVAELGVQLLDVHAAGIGRRVGELGGELGLLGFEVGHLLFALGDFGLQFTDIGSGRFDGSLRFFDLGGFFLLRAGVGEAGGQRGAFVAGLRLLEVVGVVAGVLGQAAGVHVQHRLRDLADEVHVVAHEVERAFVGLQGGDERVDRHDVEVGRRLVHEQEVRRVDE